LEQIKIYFVLWKLISLSNPCPIEQGNEINLSQYSWKIRFSENIGLIVETDHSEASLSNDHHLRMRGNNDSESEVMTL